MAQSIHLTPTKTIRLPKLVSSAQCGYGSNLNDGIEYYNFTVPYDFDGEINEFVATASGDSMMPTIYPNDMLIFEARTTPKHGDIVVAVVDGETTVKRLEIRNYSSYLVPDNKNYSEIKIENDIFVFGRVRTIRRDL